MVTQEPHPLAKPSELKLKSPSFQSEAKAIKMLLEIEETLSLIPTLTREECALRAEEEVEAMVHF